MLRKPVRTPIPTRAGSTLRSLEWLNFFRRGRPNRARPLHRRLSGVVGLERGACRLRADVWRACDGGASDSRGSHRRCGASEEIIGSRGLGRFGLRRGIAAVASWRCRGLRRAISDRRNRSVSCADDCCDYVGNCRRESVRSPVRKKSGVQFGGKCFHRHSHRVSQLHARLSMDLHGRDCSGDSRVSRTAGNRRQADRLRDERAEPPPKLRMTASRFNPKEFPRW